MTKYYDDISVVTPRWDTINKPDVRIFPDVIIVITDSGYSLLIGSFLDRLKAFKVRHQQQLWLVAINKLTMRQEGVSQKKQPRNFQNNLSKLVKLQDLFFQIFRMQFFVENSPPFFGLLTLCSTSFEHRASLLPLNRNVCFQFQ